MIKVAVLNEDNLVTNVIICEESHILASNEVISTTETREAVINGTYDADNNKFIDHKPYPSWILDGYEWKPPLDKPSDGYPYWWNEEASAWVKVERIV
jgi:hypothetical protein